MIGAARPPLAVSRKTRLSAWLLFFLQKGLSATYRVQVSGAREQLLELPQRQRAVILALWHNRVFFFATFLHRFLLPKGLRLALLASDSKDGELGALIGSKAGATVVRGSSSNRGAAGLRALYRAMVKQQQSVIILPDGSKGPIYKAKAGALMLAKTTGAPILPLSWWADRYWRIGSWDRMIIPKPFARVELVVGEPFSVTAEASDEELEERRQSLEKCLDQLGFEAEKAFGRGPAATN